MNSPATYILYWNKKINTLGNYLHETVLDMGQYAINIAE